MLETALIQVPEEMTEELGSSQENAMWIEALPARVYTTPQYGEVPVTADKLNRMIANFNAGIRGQDIATDYEHGSDTAKGKQASGWYKDFELRPSSDDPEQQSLWAKVEFTDDAKKEIAEKKWKYWSLEWDDEYFVNDSGETIQDVIIGGGLTNRPVAKRTMPINFSEELWDELDSDTQMQFAVWTTKYVNSLPNSAFLYVEPGSDTNKSKRHLPYKDSSGKIDLPHLRNAIARIPQMKGISADLKARLQAKARRLLGGTQKAASETGENGEAIKLAHELLTEQGFEVGFSEHPYERGDPGTGPAPVFSQPEDPQPDPGTAQFVARVSTDPTKDKAIGGTWRRDPLPRSITGEQTDVDPQSLTPKPGANGYTQFSDNSEGGGKLNWEELAKLLGISTEGVDFENEDQTKAFGEKVTEKITVTFSENKALKGAVDTSSEEKQFAEQFPHVWAQHQQMIERDRNTNAHAFAESVKTIKRPEGEKMLPTNSGLSALAMDKISDVHKKFSEGTATLADFEEVIKTVVHGGIVQYGENGSSLKPADEGFTLDTRSMGGLQSARKLFAEKIAEVQAEHKDDANFTFQMAISEAGNKHPELLDAYQMAAPN